MIEGVAAVLAEIASEASEKFDSAMAKLDSMLWDDMDGQSLPEILEVPEDELTGFEQELSELDKPLNEIEHKELETDDNGTIFKENGELLPNTEYEVNGYKYKTDNLGRITEASGKLRLTERDHRKTINEDMSNIGKGFEKETDDRGHLIGDQFDGSNKIENLVPMDMNLNRSEFKALEIRLAKAVKEKHEVEMTIEVEYSEDSYRPDSFIVRYMIDGEESIQIFENKGADVNG